MERAARATLETLGERISAGEARDIAERLRRVFATLRQAVGETEFADVRAQLPDEYSGLLARP